MSEDRSRQRRDDVLAKKTRLLKKITTDENQDQKDHPSLCLLSVSKSEHTNWQLQLPTTQENTGKKSKFKYNICIDALKDQTYPMIDLPSCGSRLVLV